jgi:hypothetical protein
MVEEEGAAMIEHDAGAITQTTACAAAGSIDHAESEVRGIAFCARHAAEATVNRIVHLQAVNGVDLEARRLLARELNAQGWSQSRIAERVGRARSVVNDYLRDPGRAIPATEVSGARPSFESRALALADAGRRLDEALAGWREAVREVAGKRGR